MYWMHWCLCWRSMRKNVRGSKKGCVCFWLQEHRGILEWFNIFRIEMLIRHATDGNLYLYDMVNIKKKRAPRLSNSCTVTNPFLDYMIHWTVLNVNEKKHKKSQWKASPVIHRKDHRKARFRYTSLWQLSENKIAVTLVFAGVQRFLLLLQTIVFFSSLSIFGIALILLFVMNW